MSSSVPRTPLSTVTVFAFWFDHKYPEPGLCCWATAAHVVLTSLLPAHIIANPKLENSAISFLPAFFIFVLILHLILLIKLTFKSPVGMPPVENKLCHACAQRGSECSCAESVPNCNMNWQKTCCNFHAFHARQCLYFVVFIPYCSVKNLLEIYSIIIAFARSRYIASYLQEGNTGLLQRSPPQEPPMLALRSHTYFSASLSFLGGIPLNLWKQGMGYTMQVVSG